MAHLVMFGFEEMNQPLKVYASGNLSVAERDIEIGKGIMARMWAAWPLVAHASKIPDEAASMFAELVELFPMFGRERILNGTMHPRTNFGDDMANWYVLEVDEG